jgi:CheY-like chemotaxis protein
MALAAPACANFRRGAVNPPGANLDTTADLAGAVAHDFNNILTVITGNLALAERHAAGNPKLIRLLQNIRLAAERATGLTTQLMTIAAQEPRHPAARASTAQAATETRRRVLVVEDDPDVAEVAIAVIESLGHDVERCADAGAALARMERVNDFDLVFSDIVMPGGMNGIELAEALQKLQPNLPVLLATGYSNAALAPGALRFPVLAKPYSVQELSRRIAQMMVQTA